MLAKTKPLHRFLGRGKRYYAVRTRTATRQQRAYLISLQCLMFTAHGRPNANELANPFPYPPTRTRYRVTHGIRQPFITRPTLRVTREMQSRVIGLIRVPATLSSSVSRNHVAFEIEGEGGRGI